MTGIWALALHGGAGPVRGADYGPAEAHMAEVLRRGADLLAAGGHAVDVAEALVADLEASGHHIAGRGAAANAAGVHELDAALMCGATRRAGAIAALVGFQSPIACARAVMERTPNVLLVGEGAARFCRELGAAEIADPASWFTPAVSRPVNPDELAHGTVGAVILDQHGSLAAATSTGGLLGKRPGRVGDTPLFGAGTWADERVAVSCTGQGEYFMRAAVAADVSARMRYARQPLADAARESLADMAYLGGDGGLIAVDVLGNVATPFVSEGMKRGIADWRGRFDVRTFA
jgi:isoaspartyl peptidase/L-asparaginase-like protein (Ntn-hydrolase superfamily)